MARGRGIADFVSGLTDAQAVAFADRLAGASGLLWTTGAAAIRVVRLRGRSRRRGR